MNEEFMNPGTTGMVVNEKMKADLLTSAKWAKFLCIVGCIGLAFMVIMAIFMFAVGNSMSTIVPNAKFGPVTGFIYLIVAALYVYPLMKGFQFANGVKAACLSNDESELARGFEGMRSWFTFTGILTIIALVIYALIFLIGIIAGVAVAAHSF